MEDAFNNINEIMTKNFQNIGLESSQPTIPQQTMDIDSDDDNNVHDEEPPQPPGNSANHSISTDDNTAAGPSPQKKLKGGYSSNKC